jgi:hypothetical protein
MALAIALLMLVRVPELQAGVLQCKAKVNPKTGAVEISASNVTGTPTWGPTASSTPFGFYNTVACHNAGTQRLTNCTLAEPGTNAARTPPAGCAVYVGDSSGDPACVAFLKRACTVLSGGTDGVVAIDQERATIGGVTPSDAPGFPVTIDRPGSYRLTGDLDVTGEPVPEDVTAIDIVADDVTIDLNGFSILGPLSPCSSTCPVTGAGGAGSGVDGNNRSRIAVRNGRVTGMGNHGIVLAGSSTQASQVHDVVASGNGGSGIWLGTGGMAVRCTAVSNGRMAGAAGIKGATATVIRDSVAYFNAGSGITAAQASSVQSCSTYNNGGDGIGVIGATVTGCGARLNGADGISSGGVSVISANTASGNVGYDLNLAATDGYDNNVLGLNSPASVSGGVQLGDNLCNGAFCP